MKKIFGIVATLIITVVFISCKENSLEKQRRNEMRKFDEFMRAHYSGISPRPSGLYYFQLEEGTGDSIKINDRVEIFYDLMSLDTVYTSTSGNYEPETVIVRHPSQLTSSAQSITSMRALHEALTYMRKGSRARLIFDSSLGFGQFSTGGIPGFTPLIMEVRVHKVYPAIPPAED